MSPARDMRKGSTTVLILSLVAERPMYGYQIAKELERRSEG
ncbi:MAG: PadR family transcriptional regulator, partial [Anaerolineae bacterium]|nr:PadR family transcriptional regulator [Anaerolineae bacterium]